MHDVLDPMIQAAYLSLVDRANLEHESAPIWARVGLVCYLHEQHIDFLIESEGMQNYLTMCSHYVASLFLFACACTCEHVPSKQLFRPLLPDISEAIAYTYLHSSGLYCQKIEMLAYMSLQLAVFSPHMTEQLDPVQSACTLCSRHFGMLHIHVSDRDMHYLQSAIKSFAK